MIGIILLLIGSVSSASDFPVNARVQSLTGKFAAMSGPNCWNGALYAAGLVSGIRHVDYEEFTAWLESPLCEEVEEKSATAGDIVALRRASLDGRLVPFPYSAEIHGYLFLSPKLAFTKNGTSKADGYELQDPAAIYAKYENVNKRDCRILGLPKELCQMRAQYFRCIPNGSSPAPIEEKVAALEVDLHRLYTGEYSPVSLKAEKELIKQRVDALEAELDAFPDSERSWKVELLRYRLVSARILQF